MEPNQLFVCLLPQNTRRTWSASNTTIIFHHIPFEIDCISNKKIRNIIYIIYTLYIPPANSQLGNTRISGSSQVKMIINFNIMFCSPPDWGQNNCNTCHLSGPASPWSLGCLSNCPVTSKSNEVNKQFPYETWVFLLNLVLFNKQLYMYTCKTTLKD